MTTVQTATVKGETRPTANIGAATAALLAQVPDDLAARLRDAIDADLVAVFSFALGAGRTNVWNALEKHAATDCRPFCASHITTVADGDLCLGETVRLDFRAPGRPGSYANGASLGLGYSDDEGDNAFVDLTGTDPVYMSMADLRALSLAGLKMTGGEAAR